jgi:hypothetical protein
MQWKDVETVSQSKRALWKENEWIGRVNKASRWINEELINLQYSLVQRSTFEQFKPKETF